MKKKRLKRAALQVKPSAIHGYGVFAAQSISAGELVEECLSIVTDNKLTDFASYSFDANGKSAIVLGYGSIYNHAVHPNTLYQYDSNYNTIVFRACKAIKRGEEITINYGDQWFSSRDMPIVPISGWRHWIRFLHFSLQRICMIIVMIALVYFFLIASNSK